MERAPGNASVTLSGFLVLAPSDINDITCLFADLQLDFPDSSMVKIIKDNEIVVRNLIYSVINDAMLSSSKKAIEKTADALVDPNGGTYYLARLELNPESFEELKGQVLVPGMPAEVFITTGSRTFLEYLMKPLSDSVARSFRED